jgi:hypothetical protein
MLFEMWNRQSVGIEHPVDLSVRHPNLSGVVTIEIAALASAPSVHTIQPAINSEALSLDRQIDSLV